ncbi:ribosome recycling factor [Dichelobacter nodosus]|uniref:Ribosome-recycling factor n=1 Tax=Dichelobacter nodosus (strain VCS1703A) TaxID=246195 RepID=RRF_DICNV|nr:ribosome recycling factor [Dichelobacter nodosus]A5EV26.1 RecName: Full=Ribosome-recycling factor; Short=RRF; AltName: Full=Ribosome-releasing factor [Dichelobacter nodosus VCS1703A]ABQ13091.1 ribosome recycling factor [Dichelobacter nodosus VCS1703A]AXM45584.1 ribosome recycling factor [Dichelobacter nodosus]KNZ38933.1 ribosome-recycling factor [Dichelobacter nodosus]TGA66268.1 ribosome recycling factor [Dichelobacter nodosus]
MTQEILKDTQSRMKKSVQTLEADLTKIRTGRANVSLLDHIEVEYYGAMVPLSQAANVNVTDHRTLSIQIWERDMVAKIEKAIINSDLGLTPNTAGQNIHINLPPLTEERRKEMVKVVKNEGEQAKIAVRNIRRDANQSLSKLLTQKEISEDEQRKSEEEIQKITDHFVAEIDKVLMAKEKELMEL